MGEPDADQQRRDHGQHRPIIRNGGDWYAGIGTPSSNGTKVFALAGRVVNTGLVEVPMGITLREIVYDVGGGIREDRPFKAVQTGGPSGGCIPPSTWTCRSTTSRWPRWARSWGRAA